MGRFMKFPESDPTNRAADPFEMQDTPSTTNSDSKGGKITPGTASPTTLLHVDVIFKWKKKGENNE